VVLEGDIMTKNLKQSILKNQL